jgi:hypothetical protein
MTTPHKMKLGLRGLGLLVVVVLLAACAPGTPQAVGDLPTLADLPTLTPTLSETPSLTPTASLTATVTATITPTLPPTITVTPSATITDTPTHTPSPTSTPTPNQGPLNLLLEIAARTTVLPQAMLPTTDPQVVSPANPQLPASCPELPAGGFGTLFLSTPVLIPQIGCPVGGVSNLNSAMQTFERGTMVWVSGPIYVLFGDGRYRRFDDTFNAATDPASGGEVAPPGLVEPVRGFGKVWRNNPDVRSGLGWGTTDETGGSATVQRFAAGWMLDLTQRGDVLVLVEDPTGLAGTWQALAGSY